MNNKEWKKWLFWFSFAVATIVVYKTIDSVYSIFLAFASLFKIVMPFIIAILIAYILFIPCKKVEEGIKKIKFLKGMARGLSVLFVYAGVVLLFYAAIKFVLPSISSSIMELATNIPNYYNQSLEYVSNLDSDSILIKLNVDEYLNQIGAIKLDKAIMKYATLDNLEMYWKGLAGATSFIFNAFVAIVVSVYMLVERNDIKSFMKNLGKATLDKKQYELVAKYYEKTNGIFFSYIASQILDAFVVGIITTIAMLIMHVKYAVLLGFLIGLFNVIPYFGAIVAIVISILITIFTGGFIKAAELALVVIVLQQIDANIINPKILGTSLSLSPILIIFAVTIGGTYFGVLGMFLGVPVIAFIKLILDDYIAYKITLEEKVK